MEIEIKLENGETIKHDLDLSAHKLVTSEKVEEIVKDRLGRKEAQLQGDFETKLKEAHGKIETLQKEVESKSSGASQTEIQIKKLTETIDMMKAEAEQAKAQARSERNEKLIIQSVNGKPLIEGAVELYKSAAKSALQEDGTFMLSDGTTGDGSKFAEQFFSTPSGKALVLSDARGGTGADHLPGGGDGGKIKTVAQFKASRGLS